FRPIENIIAKYNINFANIYNFNKTNFIIGIIINKIIIIGIKRYKRLKLI
ncbi:uncharacterized protein NECHADRAFT_56225, partial [Fusarium vanettenii 77-13-4]